MKKAVLFIAALVLSMLSAEAKTQVAEVGYVVRDTLNGVPCRVYLPHDYTKRAKKTEFPVLYLHHGMWGMEDDWTEQGHLVHHMDSLLRIGRVREMVVVMPDNCPHRETSEEERDNAMSGEWERQFPQFMAETERKYRVSKDPEKRAIAGLSMGGFHTMHVSYYLHDSFRYVGMFSPAIKPSKPNDIYDRWEEEVRLQLSQRPLYWIAIGREDYLYDDVQEYRRWLEANHLEYTYYESSGGHTWPNWQDYICRFLQLLF